MFTFIKSFFAKGYTSHEGYFRSGQQDKLRKGTIYLYNSGFAAAEYLGDLYECEAVDASRTVFRIVDKGNQWGLTEFYIAE